MARPQAARRAAAVTAALLLLGGTAPAAAAVSRATPSLHGDEASPSAGVTPTDAADPHAEHDAAEHEEALTHEAGEAEEHGDHGQPGTATGTDEPEEHGDHGTGPDTVSRSTRAMVLSGFGVVNTAVIGAAVLLRRRDRLNPSRAARQTRESRR